MCGNGKIHNFYSMGDELRKRLMEIHKKMLVAFSKRNAIALYPEETADLCKFMNLFLYD